MFDANITIQGGAFQDPTTLQGLLEDRMNIVFGRNGSGKSTIARAFREQTPDQTGRQATHSSRNYELSFNGSGSLPSDVCKHIFVFNEDFIDENIKIKDNLKSIIRIGKSAAFDKEIEDAKNQITQLVSEKTALEADLTRLNGSAGTPGSIAEADKAIRDALKQTGGFLERRGEIDGSSRLSPKLVEAVLSVDPADRLSASLADALSHLNEQIRKYQSRQDASSIDWQLPDYSHLPSLKEINDLLAKTVRPTSLTDEEQRILNEIAQLSSENFLEQTESLILEGHNDFCPLCHRPLSEEYKQTLRQRLLVFRDKTVEEFKKTVKEANAAIYLLDPALPSFPTTDYEQDIATAEQSTRQLNDFVSTIKDALRAKESNPYVPMDPLDADQFLDLLKKCQDALTKIAVNVQANNDALKENEKLKQALIRENTRLAYHENKSWIDLYHQLIQQQSNTETALDAIQNQIQQQEELIAHYNAECDQVNDAKEQINKYINQVFGNNKLRLAVSGKDNYKLQIRKGGYWEDLPPKAISSGERNVLALAYFFACVLEKKNTDYDYSEPTLLVIDDPVSSFDAENKEGVICLVAGQCRRILEGNPDSKILVLTHDYTTLRDLCERRQNAIEANNNPKYGNLNSRHQFRKIDCKHIHENMDYYSSLVELFNFAKIDNPEEYQGIDSIGNTIRKFAEAYASRTYKCSWTDMLSNERILNTIPDNSFIETIRNFGLRNVLNSESHEVEGGFEPWEIQRSARILLTFLLHTDYKHLYSYLVGYKSTENEWKLETIRQWGNEDDLVG